MSPRLSALPIALLAACIGPSCRTDLAPHIQVPRPYEQQGIRIEVLGTKRGPLGRYLGIFGNAYNDTGRKLESVELGFRGIGLNGEELAIATTSRAEWPVGEPWKFQARFPLPGLENLYDMMPGEVKYDPPR